jgi:aldehyde:ferredoxin oxidoreductase
MRILRVDLGTGKCRHAKVSKEDERKFLGGRGLAAKLLYDENPPRTDALGPRNRLIFMTGPYTGTLGPFTAFHNITTKSPLTGAILSAHAGGSYGPMLRSTGYDGILISGRASNPVYLLLTDEGPELMDASGLWGMDAYETTSALEARHKGARAAVIGQAGERLVRYASIMNDMSRAAGRGGAGAVMGSKLLKAVVIRGSKRIEQADPGRLQKAFDDATKATKAGSRAFSRYGTAMVVGITGRAGAIPTRNFQSAYFSDFEKISGEELVRNHVSKSTGCLRCPIMCGKKSRASREYSAKTEGPEYETIAMFGANLGNSNLESIIAANELCNRHGMDTISCADTIACAFEMFQDGVITEKDTGGMRLEWGDHRAIVRLVEMTAGGEGFGKLIGEGSRRLASRYGPGAEKYAMNVKGMEFPGYDARSIQGMSLAYATSTRGACHLRATMYVPELFQGTMDRFTVKGKAAPIKESQEFSTLLDCMILCKFGARSAFGNSWESVRTLVVAATGRGYSVEDLRRIGARGWTLERLFNLREGLRRRDDTLPERFFDLPVPEGPSKGAVVNREDFENELQRYYSLWGWTKEGRPTSRTLRDLGISC